MALVSWAFLFIAFATGVTIAIYQSNSNYASITFIVFIYLDLLALFACSRYYKQLDPESPKRLMIKALICGLTTRIMPLPGRLIIWSMGPTTSCLWFYALFLVDN